MPTLSKMLVDALPLPALRNVRFSATLMSALGTPQKSGRPPGTSYKLRMADIHTDH
jgi:hypothetical protein